ncbi:MAG: hypothetical protein ACWGQW_00475 [bacterium]
MLQFSIEHVENHNFLINIELVEPMTRRNGVIVEDIDMRTADDYPAIVKVLPQLGFYYLGEDENRDAYLYALDWWGYMQFKCVAFLFKMYQRTIVWLYRYGRVIQEIPVYEPMSIWYFTPLWIGRKLWKNLVHLLHLKRLDTSHSERN